MTIKTLLLMVKSRKAIQAKQLRLRTGLVVDAVFTEFNSVILILCFVSYKYVYVSNL